MKKLTLTLFLVVVCSFGFAQNKNEADSLIHLLPTLPNDTNKVWVLEKIANHYGYIQMDIGIKYAQKGLDLAQKIQFEKGEAMCLTKIGWLYNYSGDYIKSLEYQLKALKIAEPIQYKPALRKILGQINATYRNVGNYDLALIYNFKVIKLAIETNTNIENALRGTGETYFYMNRLDSALYFALKAYSIVKKDNIAQQGAIPILLGRIYNEMGDYKTALKYYQKSIPYNQKIKDPNLYVSYYRMAITYQNLGKTDSCIYFAEKSLAWATKLKVVSMVNGVSTLLATVYDTIAPLKALKYYRLVASVRDSVYNTEKSIQFQKISLNEQHRQQEILAEKERYNNLLWRYGLMLGLLFMGVIAFILFRNNQHKQKTNQQLQQQKDQIEKTLTKLKSTQTQLIQSEKLASLGELTAGIAHEIQNPLNFVNNFSEMSVELAKELNEEIDKEVIDKDLVKDLVSDLTQNQQKINLHGKRASSIVSGMLEHSRASTGERVLTDINKLADEYLRLSYHGIRAKNSNFNSDYKTDFDENLPKINVIPQDMGRVILNLINNAFWAVKTVEKPLVVVKTEQNENQLIIKVIDNGTGMTDDVKAKIFQPFFTTKPTGQGTGLGLSLAYDIVTKGHSGTIEVQSKQGEGSEFMITLPMTTN